MGSPNSSRSVRGKIGNFFVSLEEIGKEFKEEKT
jgi:hypothetical protein